jgi:hypothetical protein
LVIIGCKKEKYEYGRKLLCSNCKRVIYDGPFEIDRNGIPWPVGQINHCTDWDINCVSELLPEQDRQRKYYFGYEHGRKDALEFRYEKEMDPKVYHPIYIEAYKKGYKEVQDVRRDGTTKEN